MRIEDLLEELRHRQSALTQQRVEASAEGKEELGERYREELLALVRVEDRLLHVLSETYALLQRKPDVFVPPRPANATEMACGKRSLPVGATLETTYKGKPIKARVNRNGKIIYQNESFNSIAALATRVTGKDKNHLRNRKFWSISIPEEGGI